MFHNQLSAEGEGALFYNVCQFLWCKYSDCGLVQAAMMTSLTTELRSVAQNQLSGTSNSQQPSWLWQSVALKSDSVFTTL